MKIIITIYLLLSLILMVLFILFIPLDTYINKLPDHNKIKKFWKKHIIDKDPFNN